MGSFIKVDSLSYCGKEGQKIFSDMIYDLPLPAGITHMDGLTGKTKVYGGEIGDVWQEYNCDFTPEGEVILDEKYIEPARIKVNMEECYDKFDNTYLTELKRQTLQEGIPVPFSDWFFERLKKRMAKQYQDIFWRANKTAGTGVMKVIDGVETILKGSETATKITGSVLTLDNIIPTVEAAVLKAFELIKNQDTDVEDEYVILMNSSAYNLLLVALGKDCSCNGTTSVFKNYVKDGDTLRVMGIKVNKARLSNDTIVVGPERNIIIGYDTEDSQIEYRLINLRETTGENKFRIIALSNIAAQVYNEALFVVAYKE